MKIYKDNKRSVKPHSIKEGDKVIRRRKSTKANSPYDPTPYKVTKVRGTQITAKRGREEKTRDAQRWKKIRIVAVQRPYPVKRHVQQSTYLTDPDIGVPENNVSPPENVLTPPNSPTTTPPNSPPRSPPRPRTPPPPPMRQHRRPSMYPVQPQSFSKALNDHPNIIWASTPANRPSRTRRPPQPVYVPPP